MRKDQGGALTAKEREREISNKLRNAATAYRSAKSRRNSSLTHLCEDQIKSLKGELKRCLNEK